MLRPEDPKRARQVLLMYAAIVALIVVGVVVTVVLDSMMAGLVVIAGGAGAVGGIFGLRLAREMNPEMSTGRMVFATIVTVLLVIGVIVYTATK